MLFIVLDIGYCVRQTRMSHTGNLYRYIYKLGSYFILET